MTPKISVIVPVYKVEKYLPKCIDSILAQTFTDFELLLIDDGSPDNLGAICDEYAKKDSRIRVFHKDNGGVSSARNLGLDEAKGEWIWFVDSDDWVAEGAIRNIIDTIENNDVDVLQISIQGVTSGINGDKYAPFDDSKISPMSPIDYVKTGNYNGTVSSSIFSHKIISDNNLRFLTGLKLGEDQLFLLEFFHYSISVMKTNFIAYYYRINMESATNTASFDTVIDSVDAICDFKFKEEFSIICDDLLIRRFAFLIYSNPKNSDVFSRIEKSNISIESVYPICQKYNINPFIRIIIYVVLKFNSFLIFKVSTLFVYLYKELCLFCK